jgi:hypothetical protein
MTGSQWGSTGAARNSGRGGLDAAWAFFTTVVAGVTDGGFVEGLPVAFACCERDMSGLKSMNRANPERP